MISSTCRSPAFGASAVHAAVLRIQFQSSFNRRIPLAGLPQLNWIALRIIQTGESTIGIIFRTHCHGDPGRSQPGNHSIRGADPEIDHRAVLWSPEVTRILSGRRKYAGAT